MTSPIGPSTLNSYSGFNPCLNKKHESICPPDSPEFNHQVIQEYTEKVISEGEHELQKILKIIHFDEFVPISSALYDAIVVTAAHQDSLELRETKIVRECRELRETPLYQDALQRTQQQLDLLKIAEEKFEHASGPDKAGMLTSLGMTMFVPGRILKTILLADSVKEIANISEPETCHTTTKSTDNVNSVKENPEAAKPQPLPQPEPSESKWQAPFLNSMTSLLGNLNAIVDPKSLKATLSTPRASDESFAKEGLPLLHTAFNAFRFADPKKAERVTFTIQHTNQMLSGASSMIDALLAAGIAGLASEGFALASGNFLLGLAGLIKLFQKPDNSNAQLLKLVQQISQQIALMHQDLLEGFRAMSIAMGIMDFHVVSGFIEMEALLTQNQKDSTRMYDQLREFLYIDRVYIEAIKTSLEGNERYHILQQINDADWRETIDEVQSDCDSYPKAMSVETFKKSIAKLTSSLKKVQRDGLFRADEANVITEAGTILASPSRLNTLLSVASTRVTENRPKSLADNYRLATEQNIHLFVKYLQSVASKIGLAETFPPLESLYNPAALLDLSETAKNLIQTYRNTSFYLGLPEEPLKQSLNLFVKGIDSHEALTDAASNKQLREYLADDYLHELDTFANLVSEYREYAAVKYYGENVLPRLQRNIQKTELAITGLDKSKTSDFFQMQGPRWFEYQWVSWWENETPHWSPDVWNRPSCHKKKDRPCYIPSSEIEKTKNIYQESHHTRAGKIHKELIGYHQNKKIEVMKSVSFSNPDFRKNLIDFFYYDNSTLLEWRATPHHFINEEYPLLVPSWHLDQIPNAAFDAAAIGNADLNFISKPNPDGTLQLKVDLSSEEIGFTNTITVFQQISKQLPGHNQKLGTLESLHYTWFGGDSPTGDCTIYDPDLKRFTGYYNRQDYDDYEDGKAAYDCPAGSCFTGHRAIICMPNTETISGIFSNYSSYSVLSSDQALKLAEWPHTTLNEVELQNLEANVQHQKKTIRQVIMKNLATILNSGSNDATLGDRSFPEHLRLELVSSFHRLSVKERVLKMDLSLTITPKSLDLDQSWPNIFGGGDVLRELERYKGQRVYLDDMLRQNHRAFTEQKPKLIKAAKSSGAEHYPFMNSKEVFQEFVEQITETDVVPNMVAESKPENFYQLKQFANEFIPSLEPSLREKLKSISPDLNKLSQTLEKPDPTQALPPIVQTSGASRATPFFVKAIEKVQSVVKKLFNWGKSKDRVYDTSSQPQPLKEREVQTCPAIDPNLTSTLAKDSISDLGITVFQLPNRVAKKTDIPMPGYSTFLQPQTFDDRVIVAQWLCLSVLNKWFPWNYEKEISSQTKNYLEEQARVLSTLEDKFDEHLEEESLSEEILLEADYLLDKTEERINSALKWGKVSSTNAAQIDYDLSRIQSWLKV